MLAGKCGVDWLSHYEAVTCTQDNTRWLPLVSRLPAEGTGEAAYLVFKLYERMNEWMSEWMNTVNLCKYLVGPAGQGCLYRVFPAAAPRAPLVALKNECIWYTFILGIKGKTLSETVKTDWSSFIEKTARL